MRVFSFSNEYTILTRLHGGRRFTALDREKRPCLIVVEKKTREARFVMPMLEEWVRIEEFSDFYEFFPYNGGIVAVFAHHADGVTLDRALGGMPFEQRAAVLRGVFALILRQYLPWELLRDVMSPENLLVYPSGRVEILYDLPRGSTFAIRHTVKSICGDCSVPELDALFAKLENAASYDPTELYRQAVCAADRIAGYTPPPKPEKLTFGDIQVRVKAVKLAVQRYAAAILALTVLLAGYIAVGILFYRTVIAPPPVDNGIAAIGTVVIEDGS